MTVDLEEVQAALTRDETGTLCGQTMGLVAVTAGTFALGAYLASTASPGSSRLFFLSCGSGE